MPNVYRVSSTVKVAQMEAELSAQFSALRTEVEENGVPLGEAPSKSYSSVPLPKDISFFRTEREQALRRGLQVSEALPVVSPAQVIQAELDSCLNMEYTAESLPLLLHQFYADRSYQLAQLKHQLMLRWARFCRHSGVIEKMYPHYKKQMSYMMNEYDDAVQRARRLAVSREKILTDRGNPINVVTQDDVVIYLKWLVCHLHSVKTIHNFLHVIHYIPSRDRKDKGESSQQTFTKDPLNEPQHLNGLVEDLPIHTVQLNNFRAELHSLVSYFHLPYDIVNLRTTGDEMELFSMVSREFRTIFRKQELMKTFPQCDSTEVKDSQWGRKSPSMALKKEANWIPFIQVKPLKQDPWQKKLIAKLKEHHSVDELLKMYCRFLQASDLPQVCEALRQHAAHVCEMQGGRSSSVASHTSRPKEQKTSQIWASIYNVAAISEDTKMVGSSRLGTMRGLDKSGWKSKVMPVTPKSKSYSYMDSVQLLGLDGSPEEGTSDPIITRGAYLSLIYLRHLKIRELQRVSLGMLNYLRSVERTLTIDLAGLCSRREGLVVTADETGWMNAARGGSGLAGGLGSLHYSHNSPVDYKLQCSEFMEFPEVENLHDFYSTEGRFIHTQDQRGLYVVYDVALQDLEEQENLLAIVASQFIQRNRKEQVGKFEGSVPSATDVHSSRPLGRTDVDRVAVLLDLWTCETEFLESKVQLLNCYYEAYQHVSGCEERFAMAQVITDIMHRRPQLDLGHDYFVQAYRAEMACLQSHHNLIRAVLDCQIDQQRQYIQRIWRGDQTGSVNEYGLPPNYVPKHLVSLGGGSPALNNIFLLEVHPSLCLAASVYHTLAKAHTELCRLQGAVGLAERVNLEHRLLQQALQDWSTLTLPGASYSSQTQKDLFSDVFFDDPTLVQGVGLSLIRSAEERDMRQGKEKQFHAVETLSKLLELVSIRHRLVESASETAHLSQLYRNMAIELGFDEFHLYLRPVQFELAVHKDKLEHGPVFITALLEDNSCVDRYIPSSLPLSIQELDESQIGRFSFNSVETVVHLMSRPSIENLQVTLACQVAQKNALVSVVKQVCLCYWAETSAGPTEGQESIPSDNEAKSSTCLDSQTCRDNDSIKKKAESVPSKAAKSSVIGNKNRLMEAFVSIQLEKVGLRDEMLNSFFKKKQAMGGLIKTPEEVAKIKRKLILEFCKKFSMHMSQYCVRAQIIAYCYSLTSLLHDSPIVRQSNFMIGQARQKVCLDSEVDLCPDPRTFQRRLRRLLSADGKALINLWFIPHYSEVLPMFKTIDASASAKGLHHTLEIMSSLHDIVYYLVSFARLGNTGEPFSSLSWRRRPEEAQAHLSADWGGTEGIGAELWDIQRQVDSLSDPGSPEAVSRLLQLRRQVLFLQFDNAVRHLIREAFLSSGDMVSYQSVSDNMVGALPLLSDSIRPTVYSSLLSVPQPLEPQSLRAQRMYPWRCFLACHGLHPVDICDIPPIEYCMQLCLSGLGDEGRKQANAAMLGVSLLMEDVLGSGLEVEPLCLHDNKNDDFPHGRCDEEDRQCLEAENEETHVPDSMVPLRDPIQVQSVLKGFLQLTKQLQVFKESWARTHLAVKRINTPSLYRQFLKLYRSEIFYPSMRALALQLGKECEYEALISRNQSLLPPPGASEVDVRTWQLHRLLECTECDMIRTVQKRINRELTLVISERTRQDTGLPTELWIKAPLKHTLSPERPQVVERFILQLMENAEEVDGQVRVSEAHLRGCLTELGCSVMERECRSFLLYSQFYEQILQQQTQLLYQKEQDIKNLDSAQSHTPQNEVAALCRGMMLEMSALQARVTQLEEENNTLEEQLSLKYRQQYDAWVRQLLSTCIQLKARLDEYHLRMEQDVCQLVSKVRGEGVDRIIKLRKKYGSTQEDDSLSLLLMEKDDLHEFKMENSQLSSLLCKVKALGHWRQVLHQGKLHRQLLQSQQREVICRREALKVKMMSEEEVVILQEELDATKQALDHCQTEYSRTRMNLGRKTEALHAARLQSAQEARSRQEMECHHGHSLEQMRGDMEDRERRLRELRQQLDRDGRGSQLQRQRSAKDIQQMKNQLHKERSLKQGAYQQVDKLQNQMNDHESTLSRCTSTPGLARTSQQYGNQTRDSSLVDFGAKHGHLKSRCDTKLERPKVDPSCLRALTAETLLPELFKL